MSFFKKAFAVINPVAAASTAAAMGGDIYAAHEQRKATQDANRQAGEIAARDAALQREFAQMGLRWRIADAEAAGIHPLAALGAQGATYTPSGQSVLPDYSKSDLARNMGQNISRAMNVALDPHEKAMRALTVESLQIDNAIKKKQLEGISNPGIPLRSNSSLGLHLLGQNPLSAYGLDGGSYVSEIPTVKSHASGGKPHQAAGEYTDFVFARTPTGLHPVPSKEMQEAIEDKLIPETLWAMRNYLYPSFSPTTQRLMRPSKKDHPLPHGYEWEWFPHAAEFRATNKKSIYHRSMRKLGGN